MSTMPLPGRPNEPFLFGRGGQRMTPEDIALQRELAMQQQAQAADFSPVGHWTQGLARSLGGITGGLQMRRANKASEANQAETDAVLAALLSGEPTDPAAGNNAVLAALANPYISDQAREIAGMEYQRLNPKPPQPTEFERLLTARGVQPGSEDWNTALDGYIRSKSDPLITATLPGDRFYSGPQSEIANILGGGGPTSGPGAAPPPTLPPDFFDEPTMENTPSPELGANGAPAQLSAEQYRVVVDQLGPEVTAEWARRNNITVAN